MNIQMSQQKNLWLQRLDYYIEFYEKLKARLGSSAVF